MGILAHGDDRIRDDVLAALRETSPETASFEVAVTNGVVELYGGAGDDSSGRVAELIANTVPGVTRIVHKP